MEMQSDTSWTRFCTWYQCCLRDRRGIAAIEFAIIAPMLVVMFICLTDLGLGIYANMQVDSAAQFGAQYALINGFDPDSITSAVKSSAEISDLNVVPATFCGCPGANGVNPSLACGLKCGDGSAAGSFVRVSVTHAYTTIIPYPGLPASFALASQSTVRLK
jgi:hypothetical protein